MSKKLALTLICAMVLCGLAVAPVAVAEAQDQASKLSIITTVFPAYDIAREIAGDSAEVRLLLPPGSESHSYEPTPQDIIAIQQADLFFYVGGESEHWVEGLLDSIGDNAPRTLAMLNIVNGLEEEYTKSMATEDHEYAVQADAPELDEHCWTSPKNVKLIAHAVAGVLTELDPQSAASYAERDTTYQAQLDELDAAFEQVVSSGVRKKILFGDRFPFRYLAHDYGLAYDAAFPGCSEDAEPSIQTIVSLIQEIKVDNIPVIFHIEFSSQNTANILAEETGAKVLLLHSCHNVSAEEIQNGSTYLSLMWGNVEALREALN